jgi:ParB family chromosome partitioning protein
VVPSSGAERLAWLLNQPQESVLALIAFCTASSVDLIARRAEANERADAVADALKLDVADFWSVGVENFLTHVSKAKIAAVVTEARDAQAAAPLGAMKKADACAKAAELLAGTRWLPAPMRLGTAARSADAANGGNAPSSANAA